MTTLSLQTLRAPQGARHSKKRLGCGEGSGHGKTSGRGTKGQNSRTGGGAHRHFEGGQMPLYRRIPKMGFRSQKQISGINDYQLISLDILNGFEEGAVVTAEFLLERGYKLPRTSAGFRVVANGELTKKLSIKLQKASASAIASIEAVGGSFAAE